MAQAEDTQHCLSLSVALAHCLSRSLSLSLPLSPSLFLLLYFFIFLFLTVIYTDKVITDSPRGCVRVQVGCVYTACLLALTVWHKKMLPMWKLCVGVRAEIGDQATRQRQLQQRR